jgi:hypothetical protein
MAGNFGHLPIKAELVPRNFSDKSISFPEYITRDQAYSGNELGDKWLQNAKIMNKTVY